jgi:signal peptidase II
MNVSTERHSNALRWLWLSALVIFLDQITKIAALKSMTPGVEHPVLPSFNFTLVYNRGAAWSFLSDAGGWQRWVFVALSAAISAVIVVWLRKVEPGQRMTALALALILGGALGNLVDRLMYGHVIDFIHLYYGTFHWPVFNIADSAITVGAVALAISGLFLNKPAS